MTRKGGGRESGAVNHDAPIPDSLSGGGAVNSGQPHGAAFANPMTRGGRSNSATRAAANSDACPHGMTSESERDSQTVCQYCGFERIRAFEAELADVRKWLNATHANQQDLVMERNDAVARAENAEARVKVLEAILADLRGEDRE